MSCRLPKNLRLGLNEAGQYFLIYKDGTDGVVAITLSKDESNDLKKKMNEEKKTFVRVL